LFKKEILMIDETVTNQLQQLLDSARSIFIMYPAEASLDQRAVAAALYLGLSQQEKAVQLISSRKPETQEATALAGLEHTIHEIGNQNLTISFPYSPDQVDKVSYHIGEESKRFFLTIKPKPGVSPLETSTVEFSYTGAAVDAIFLVGVKDLESLEQLYFGYEQLYQEVPTVSLAMHTPSFGTHKIDASSASSLSEVAAQLLQQLSVSLDSDIATNLLAGIEASTKNLSSPATSAETFETVARLLRAGARRSFRKIKDEETRTQQNGAVIHEVVSENTAKPLRTRATKAAKMDSLNPPKEYIPGRLM
jgi:hypothetical protein